MKRILAVALILSMMVTLMTGFTIHAEEIDDPVCDEPVCDGLVCDEAVLQEGPDSNVVEEVYSDTGFYRAAFDDEAGDRELLPDTASPVPYTDDQSVIYQRIIAMQAEYPEGRSWTNSDTYVWSNIFYPEGSSWAYSSYTGGGCVALAMILSDAAFGNMPAHQRTNVVYDDLRVGDILRINNNTHSVIILEKYDDEVVIAEGNFNYSVHWGRTLSRKTVEAANYYVTRYAKTYNCTFVTNGGSPVPAVKVYESACITEPDKPVKERYLFDGWYQDPGLTRKWNFKTAVESDITLYAKWKIDESLLLKGVSVDNSSIILPINGSAGLSAILSPAGNTANITWTSDNDCVSVKASGDGRSASVTALKRGHALITVTAVDKFDDVEITKTATAKVFVKRSGADLNAVIVAGEQKDISKAYFDDECPAGDFKFTVSPSGYATVDKKGVLTAKKAGKVTVQALDKSGQEYDSVTVNILPLPVVRFDKPLTYTGQKVSIYDAITNIPESGNYTFTRFESTKKDVADIDESGCITAGTKEGAASIKAYIAEKGADGSVKTLLIKANVALKIPRFAKNSYTLQTGQTMVIAMKNVAAASKAEFSSDDPERLTVEEHTDKKGAPTGKVIIKAHKTYDAPVRITAVVDGQVYPCSINITAPVIAKSELRIKEGKTATVSLKNTRIKKTDVEWISEDEDIATVTSGGRVTAIKKGTVKIYTETGGVKNECLVTVY